MPGNAGGAKGGRKKDCDMDRPTEEPPAPVSLKTGLTQAGDILARWAWVEPSVWTRRMLTALENGVQGGVWYSLIDKVHRMENLRAALRKVAANGGAPGADHITVAWFVEHQEEELTRLQAELREDRYSPRVARRAWLPKPGSTEKRPLAIPAVRDRVVEAAVTQVLEPIFEREFATCSYGFRPNRGAKDALREVDRLLRAGYQQVVDADFRRCFDTIPWAPLMACVRERVADGRVLRLVEAFLQRGVMERGAVVEPEEGTPQGGVISPLLANVYLNALDHRLQSLGLHVVRYADDLVVLCRTQAEAEGARADLRSWTATAGLTLHPEKTRLVDMRQPGAGFDFLGYHFERTVQKGRLSRWPRTKSLRKYKEAIRARTRSRHGQSLEQIIRTVNAVSRGWFNYFKHSNVWTFPPLDQFIRRRLRTILRRRRKRKHVARGLDHQRWPNKFLEAHGLFSLTAAHAANCQSV
jgi:RNA-directed DNA polymerase